MKPQILDKRPQMWLQVSQRLETGNCWVFPKIRCLSHGASIVPCPIVPGTSGEIWTCSILSTQDTVWNFDLQEALMSVDSVNRRKKNSRRQLVFKKNSEKKSVMLVQLLLAGGQQKAGKQAPFATGSLAINTFKPTESRVSFQKLSWLLNPTS